MCRAARALLDITQPELAEAAGLGLSTIIDLEKFSPRRLTGRCPRDAEGLGEGRNSIHRKEQLEGRASGQAYDKLELPTALRLDGRGLYLTTILQETQALDDRIFEP